MRNFVQPGHTVTLPAPLGGCSSGDGILVGALFGIAAYNALAGADVETSLEGVYTLPKAAGVLAAGQKVYWDPGSRNVAAAAASGRVLIGAAVAAAGGADATVRVRLNGTSI
jgi:predicted RecA/RadA family phage recombinase